MVPHEKKKQWIFVGKIWYSKTTMSQLLVTGTHLVLRSFLQGGSRIGDRGSDSTGGTWSHGEKHLPRRFKMF